MKVNNYTFITYGLLTLLIIFIYSISFKYKFKTAQQLSFRSLTNLNSNKETFNNKKEGFTNDANANATKNDDIFKVIENKLKGLVEELGGHEGKSETKKFL